MAETRTPVGKVTWQYTTVYYEQPCRNEEPHPKHLVWGGAGGGAAASPGPWRGEHTIDGGTGMVSGRARLMEV